MDVRIGLWRRLSAQELILLNCGVGEDSWESLGLHEIQPVHSEGDQPWDFFGRNDVKAETPVLWPPHVKSWLIGKDSDAGRDWEQEKKGPTEDEIAGWHHWLDGREYEWTPGVGDGQGGLVCCDSWGRSQTRLSHWTTFFEIAENKESFAYTLNSSLRNSFSLASFVSGTQLMLTTFLGTISVPMLKNGGEYKKDAQSLCCYLEPSPQPIHWYSQKYLPLNDFCLNCLLGWEWNVNLWSYINKSDHRDLIYICFLFHLLNTSYGL